MRSLTKLESLVACREMISLQAFLWSRGFMGPHPA